MDMDPKILKVGHVTLSRPLWPVFIFSYSNSCGPSAPKFEVSSFNRSRETEGVPKFQNWITWPLVTPIDLIFDLMSETGGQPGLGPTGFWDWRIFEVTFIIRSRNAFIFYYFSPKVSRLSVFSRPRNEGWKWVLFTKLQLANHWQI